MGALVPQPLTMNPTYQLGPALPDIDDPLRAYESRPAYELSFKRGCDQRPEGLIYDRR